MEIVLVITIYYKVIRIRDNISNTHNTLWLRIYWHYWIRIEFRNKIC